MSQAISYTQVTDVALDATGDWLIGPSPTGTDLQFIGDGPGLQQAATIALQFFFTEWFLDQSVGIPWFQSVFVKNPQAAAIQAIFRSALLAVPGIVSVQSMILSLQAGRVAAVSFQATGNLGQLISGTVAPPQF